MQAIFISYRRDDSEGQAGRLFDDLVRRFGNGFVFMDVAGIQPGLDFRSVIDDKIASCGVLLAVIGPHWLDAKDEAGKRRLDNTSDFVRLETAAALKRDIPVIPLLVQNAEMPRPEQLPEDLRDLAYRNASELTHARWDSDVEFLAKALEKLIGAGTPFQKPPNTSRRVGVIVATLVGGVVIGGLILVAIQEKTPDTTSPATSTSTESRLNPQQKISGTSTKAPIPNFAGTWQLASEDWNGFGERQRFTVTQHDRALLITGLTKATQYEIDADGKAVCRFLYTAGMTPYQSGTGEAAALVQTYAVSLAGPDKLVYENTAQYNVAIGGHAVGTDRYVQRYERVSPN